MGNGNLLFSVNVCQRNEPSTLGVALTEALSNDKYSLPVCSSPSSDVNFINTTVTAEAYEGGNICIDVRKKISGTGPSPKDYTTIQSKMCADAAGQVSLIWSSGLTIQRLVEGKLGSLSINKQAVTIPNTMGLRFSTESIKKAFQAIMAKKPKPAGSF